MLVAKELALPVVVAVWTVALGAAPVGKLVAVKEYDEGADVIFWEATRAINKLQSVKDFILTMSTELKDF